MRSSGWLLACALLLPAAARAEGVSALAMARAHEVPLQLADAVVLALRDNRAIRSARLRRRVEKFDLRVVRDHYSPQLSLKARAYGNRNQSERYREADFVPSAKLLTPYGTRLSLDWSYGHARGHESGARYRNGANLSVTQPLLRGAGRAIAGAPLRQAQLSEQLNRLALKDDVARVINQVIFLYRALLRAQEQQNIAEQALRRARQLVQVNQALISAGRMAAFEIIQAEAEVATQELALESSRSQLRGNRLALAQALAIDLATPLRAVDKVEVQQVQVDAAQALAQAEALQPAYLMQQITSEQLAIDLLLARDQQSWDLALVAGASQAHERPGSRPSWQRYVGLELEVPLGGLSLRQAEVHAEAALQHHQLTKAEVYQQLQRDVSDAVRDIKVHWRQLEIVRRMLSLSQRKLDIEREKLALGRSSNFEVLSFESDLRHAQNAYLDAAIAYLNGRAVLDQVQGSTLQNWGVDLYD